MAAHNDASESMLLLRLSMSGIVSVLLLTVATTVNANRTPQPKPTADPGKSTPEMLTESRPMEQYALGYSYEKGLYRELDYVKAAYWYRQAASQGFARAQYRLALLYMLGRLDVRDAAQAEQLFRSAAMQGYSPAQFDLAAYHMGLNPEQQKDLAESYAWFSIVADNGGADAADARQFLGHLASQLSSQELVRARQLQAGYVKQISH